MKDVLADWGESDDLGRYYDVDSTTIKMNYSC